jgi:hypothetical protein
MWPWKNEGIARKGSLEGSREESSEEGILERMKEALRGKVPERFD